MNLKPLFSTCLLLPALSLAQESDFGAADSTNNMSSMVVTANRMAQTADEVLASVSVITREDLELRQQRSVVEVLQGLPGVTVARNGGLGKVASVFLRGSESDQVLVLVDGLRVGSSSLGTYAWQDLPLDAVERIEVVRGPRSSLYGSEALGGVIQIFTRKGEGKPQLQASIGAGNHSTKEGSLAVSGSQGGFYGRLGVSGFDTDGENSCREEAGTEFGGCFTSEPDDDGYRNLSGQASAGYRFSPGNQLEFNALYTDVENEFDGSFQNHSEGQQSQLGLTLDLAPTERWSTRLIAGRSEDNLDNFLNDTYVNTYDTTKDSASWINHLEVSERVSLAFGADYLDETLESTDDFVETDRQTLGGFAQATLDLQPVRLELSGRHDDVEGQGSRWTGSFAGSVAMTENTRLLASIGNAFKTPSFNELYFPFFGNPDLEAEESHTAEFGIHHTQGDWFASATAYQTWAEKLIAFDPVAFIPVNVDRARIRGLEATLEYRAQKWLSGADFDWLNATNETGPNAGNLLPRRPERKLRLHMTRIESNWSLGGEALFVGSTYDDLGNNTKIGAWQRFDLHGSYTVRPGFDVRARVENLFDTDYETAAYYNEPGMTYWVSLHLNTAAF